jgi:hypothetical protein
VLYSGLAAEVFIELQQPYGFLSVLRAKSASSRTFIGMFSQLNCITRTQ